MTNVFFVQSSAHFISNIIKNMKIAFDIWFMIEENDDEYNQKFATLSRSNDDHSMYEFFNSNVQENEAHVFEFDFFNLESFDFHDTNWNFEY